MGYGVCEWGVGNVWGIGLVSVVSVVSVPYGRSLEVCRFEYV